MSDRFVTPPITADLAARITPGPGTIVHRKPLTVVVSTEGDPDRTARGITDAVDRLVAAGNLGFGPVAAGLQQFVVDHQPTGVAAVLDVAPDAIAFLFDQAVAIGDATTHRASGRSGWTTVFVEGDSVSLVAGPGPERPVDPWSQLWAGTVAGQGVQVDLRRAAWSEPAASSPPVEAQDDAAEVAPAEADIAMTDTPMAEADIAVTDMPMAEVGPAEIAPAEVAMTDLAMAEEAEADIAVTDMPMAEVAEPLPADNTAAAAEIDETTDDGPAEIDDDTAGTGEDVDTNLEAELVPTTETTADAGSDAGQDRDEGDLEPVIELEADPIDLSASAMPSWSWPPPVPEPTVAQPVETMANASAGPASSSPASATGGLAPSTPPQAPAAEPIAGPPPMPSGFPPPGPGAEPTTGTTPEALDAPPPSDVAPIAGPPPMPSTPPNGLSPGDLPPPPPQPGAEPIAGPPPMPGAAARRADRNESD